MEDVMTSAEFGSTGSDVGARQSGHTIPVRVLVIDDDQWIRDLICMTLEEEGYAADKAANGEAALRHLDTLERNGRRHPDVILLDMRMPVMDGWTFAREYLSRPGPHARIVVITAATDAAHYAAEVGADGALAKPFNIEELLAVVGAFARAGSLAA
jgi:two-component system, chemotaxis family, chemotaxis protein CheY